MKISQVAKRFRLQTSAIRYYERIGLLPLASRIDGQRCYDETALTRLAVVQRARQVGFTLEEIRQLFFSFSVDAHPPDRWKELSKAKLAELDEMTAGIEIMRRLLKRTLRNCHCDSLEQCGRGILKRDYSDPTGQILPVSLVSGPLR